MSERVLIEFQVDSSGAIKSLKRVKNELKETAKPASSAASAFGVLKKNLALVGTVIGALGLAKLGRSMATLAGNVISTGATFETLAIQMQSVTGSARAGQQAMEWIVDFTASTPYQLETVTNSFIKLKAMGIDPSTGAMQAIADATSYLGGETDVMNSLVLALGKSMTVGKMSMEEMRMMMERGVPVIDLLAKVLNKTTGEINEMSRKGELNREVILKLIPAIQEWAGPASQALMNTFSGAWSNLKDNIQLAFAALADLGILDVATAAVKLARDAVGLFTAALQDLAGEVDTTGLVRTLEKLSDQVTLLGRAFDAEFMSNLANVVQFMVTWASVAIEAQIVRPFSALVQAVTNFNTSGGSFIQTLKGLKQGWEDIGIVVPELVTSHETLTQRIKRLKKEAKQNIAVLKVQIQGYPDTQIAIADTED
jgi:tape measure domain-containing protein